MAETAFTDEQLLHLIKAQQKKGADRAMSAWFVASVVSAVAIGFTGSRLDADQVVMICTSVQAMAFGISYFSI